MTDEAPPGRPSLAVVVSFVVAGLLVVGAAVAFAVLRRGGTEGPAPIGPPRGEVAVAYPDEPATLNPYAPQGDTAATRDLVRPVLPTLLRITPDLRYGPSLAVRVPRGDDIGSVPFSVTFHLDPEAVWSDGVPVTADDVRFTWQVVVGGTMPVADRNAYQRISDVVVLDPHTVRLEFAAPYAWWHDLFSAGDFVLPRHALEGRDVAAELHRGVPVSAGPYVVESWTPGLELVYAANPRWWGDGPGFARVRVFFVPDLEMAVQLLERGDVQVVPATTQPGLERRLREDGAIHLSSRWGSNWWELVFHVQGPVTRNPVVRQAVGFSLDRTGMVEAFGSDDARPLNSLVAGWAPGASEAFGVVVNDAERARGLLADAALRPPPVTLAGPGNSEMGAAFQGAIQAALARIGMTAEVAGPDGSAFYADWLREGRFDLAVVERRGSPMMWLGGSYRSDRHPPNGVNYARLASVAVDESLDVASGVVRIDEALPDVVMRRLAASLPAIPLAETKVFVAWRPGVLGPSANATVEGPLWNVARWRPET